MPGAISEKLAVYTSLPRPVLMLCLGSFINRAGSFLVPFLAIYVTEELGYTKTFAGYCFAAFGLGAIVAAICGGQLADRIGRRPVMLTALFGAAGILIVLSFVSSKPALLAAIFCFSLIADMYRPAASAMMGDLVDSETRPIAFGLMYVAFNLGFGVAAGVGGFLLAYSPTLLFWGDAFTTASYGLIIAFFIAETLPEEVKAKNASPTVEGETPEWRTAIKRMLADTNFVLFAAATFLSGVVFMQGFSTLPLYMSENNLDRETIGLLLSTNGWLIVFLQLPVTTWLSKRDHLTAIIAGELLIGLGFGLTMLASTWVFFLGTILIWTFGEIVQATFKHALVAELAPVDLRARYMGVFSLCFATAMTIGIPVASRVMEHFGSVVLWSSCVGLALMASILFKVIQIRLRSKAQLEAALQRQLVAES